MKDFAPSLAFALLLGITPAGCSNPSHKDSGARPCGGDVWTGLQLGSNTLSLVATSVKGTNNAGDKTLQVSDTANFRTDDEVLIITMVDETATACDASAAGTWELNYVAIRPENQSGLGTLDLAFPLEHDYVATATRLHQVIRVPSYEDVLMDSGQTLTAPAWNGATGGVLALRAQTLTLYDGAAINMDEKGYRGGTTGTVIGAAPTNPEGPLGRTATSGGGPGGSGGLDHCYGDGDAGQGQSAPTPALGGGGGNSGGSTVSAGVGGNCGGGGGGGTGPDGGSSGGTGAASGGKGATGNYAPNGTSACSLFTTSVYMDRGGGGGGGCPFDVPATCITSSSSPRWLMGSGAPAGASGGCSGNASLGAGGPGGTAAGNHQPGCFPVYDSGVEGGDGAAGGGLIVLLADTITSADTGGTATLSAKGGAGGNGGAGSYIGSLQSGRGYAGGGGGGGAQGASGGMIVLVTSTVEGPGRLAAVVDGGSGGSGGGGGFGTCGDCVAAGCPVFVLGGASGDGTTGTPGAGQDASPVNCGGGGGGGRKGDIGAKGVVHASNASTLSVSPTTATPVPLGIDNVERYTCP